MIICVRVFRIAPGTYSPEKVNLDKGPQYSLTGKGPAERPADTPGVCKLHLQIT